MNIKFKYYFKKNHKVYKNELSYLELLESTILTLFIQIRLWTLIQLLQQFSVDCLGALRLH